MYDAHHYSARRGHARPEYLLILGETTFRRDYRRFGLLPADRLRHLWIIGKTGSGKSTLLASLLAQDLRAGMGVALLDPHGDLVDEVLPHVPDARTNEVLLFDPSDRDFPVSFNVFRQGRRFHADRALLAAELIAVFKKFWTDSWGPRLEHVLRNAILAVLESTRATLLFLYRFLTDEQLREKLVPGILDPVVRQFWTEEFPRYGARLQAEALAPVLNKLGAFVANPIVRGIVGQERSRVDLGELMNRRGILLAPLATGRIGEDASHLLGALLLTSLQLAAMERGTGHRPPFIVYVDEFQHFVTGSIAAMLSEARKFGLGLVLAHQYLGQLPEAIQGAVLGNIGSAVLFRVGAGDALTLEAEFSPPFTAYDLQNLPRYHAVVKLLARGETLAPFSARTLPLAAPPPGAPERIAKIRAQSRQRFAQGRAAVEAAIAEHLGPPAAPHRSGLPSGDLSAAPSDPATRESDSAF